MTRRDATRLITWLGGEIGERHCHRFKGISIPIGCDKRTVSRASARRNSLEIRACSEIAVHAVCPANDKLIRWTDDGIDSNIGSYIIYVRH